MSNPTVFELGRVEVSGEQICIEDNVGEGIHLHIGLLRVDMTVSELCILTQKIKKTLDVITPKKFRIEDYDPYFLERISPYISYITDVEESYMSISDIGVLYEVTPGKFSDCSVVNSPAFNYYMGVSKEMPDLDVNIDIFQNQYERAQFVFEKINNSSDICAHICVDEQNYVLDGYYTLSALAKIKGIHERVKVSKIKINPYNKDMATRRLKRKKW